MIIKENMLFRWKDSDQTIRILHVNSLANIAYVIDRSEKFKRWPYVVKMGTLREKAIEETTEEAVICSTENLTEAEREYHERAVQIVKRVLEGVEHKEQLFMSDYRAKVVQKVAQEFGVTPTTVKKYLLAFWKRGQHFGVLVPNFKKCGGKYKERKAGERKRGRPRSDGKTGMNVDERVKKIFKTALNRYYYGPKNLRLQDVYELMLKDFFSDTIQTQDGEEIKVLQDKYPTIYQFRYWFKKENNVKKEVSKRLGEEVYQQRYRPITGNATQDAGLGPATLWQVDSTIFDVYLVSSLNRNLIIGRPILYVVVDIFSHLIVGIHVSLENFNSYSGVMMALFNSMTSKQKFCQKYGVNIRSDEWDVACIPQRILADRGELNNTFIESAIENLGITIQNNPPYRPDYKGHVEKMFDMIKSSIDSVVDGVFDSKRENQRSSRKDWRLEANLTVQEFTKIVIQSVIHYNNHHVLSNYVLTKEMLEAGVQKIPRRIWEYGINNQKGVLRTLHEDVVKFYLLPSAEAVVTPKGVMYKNMAYVSDFCYEHNWFGEARTKGHWKVRIWYDPTDLGQIYTLHNEKPQPLYLVEHFHHLNEKTIYEIEQTMEEVKKQEKRDKEVEQKERINLINDIEKIVNQARKEAKKQQSTSKNQRLQAIKENREQEKKVQRSFMRDKQGVEEEDIDDDLDLFRKLRR
ncbi:Mu transposase C-terminal domain-containing protein [Geobacillus icigianus]